MQKVFNFKSGTIHIENLDKFDQKKLKKHTEDFLRKVVKERIQNGNSYSTGNFKEQ